MVHCYHLGYIDGNVTIYSIHGSYGELNNSFKHNMKLSDARRQ